MTNSETNMATRE